MLIILSTHPIQYQIPLWRALAASGQVPFEVWYLSDHGVRQSYDVEFGKTFSWDLEMLEGYPHRFLNRDPSVKVNEFWSAGLPESFHQLLADNPVSAIWVQGWQVRAYWQAIAAAHKRGIAVWLRGESNDLATTKPLKRIAKRLALGWLFQKVSWFLCIGTANARLYAQYGVGAERMKQAPYCIDNARFAAQANMLRPQRNAIRQRWGIPQDAFCPLFVGKFIPKKRPLDLLAAAKRLGGHLDGIPLHPLFVGSGELGPALRAACQVSFDAETEGASSTAVKQQADLPHASFAGFLNQTEVSAAYVAADCLVLPSDSNETWGLVVNEAMASGLPCIVSDACGSGADLVAPLQAKSVFALGSIDGLIAALRVAASDPIDPARLWQQVERFNPQVSIDTVIELHRAGA